MKGGLSHIPGDLKKYGPPFGVIGAYLVLMNVVFGLSVCPVALLTGFPCPACGITRAAVLFLKGEFVQAFWMHPFFYAVLVMAVMAAFLRYGMDRDISWMRYLAAAVGVLAILYYIYRMAAFFPEQEPMIYQSRSLLGLLRSQG
ncbi:MAG: DUF2752 domain-containing protein [Blautia sp.]|jgi:hypothetical protein